MKTLLNLFNTRKRSQNNLLSALIAMDEQLENSRRLIANMDLTIEILNKQQP